MILILSGGSATASAYADYAANRLVAGGCGVRVVGVRGLPTTPLLRGDPSHPVIADVLSTDAAAVLVVAAVARASTSGLLKGLVELLRVDVPALPVAVGGFAAHARVLDYAIRPALGSRVLPTVFLADHRADLAPLHDGLAVLVAKSRGSGRIRAASVPA